jgi:hypothetical protein
MCAIRDSNKYVACAKRRNNFFYQKQLIKFLLLKSSKIRLEDNINKIEAK